MTDHDYVEQESAHGIDDYLGFVKRRRWWLLGLASAGWAIAMVAGYVIPPKYKSETVILVDEPKVPAQYVTPNVTLDLQSQLQSLTQQILSRTRLLRIIHDFHLYDAAMRKNEDAAIEAMRHDIGIEEVKAPDRPVELSGFKISYLASSPRLAHDVTDRLASLFIEENLRNQQQLSEDTTKFLESQVEDARRDLERQERQLQLFRSSYLGELPEQTQSNMQILAGLQGRLEAATEALNHSQQQKLYLESLLSQYRRPHPQTPSEATSSAAGGDQLQTPSGRELERLKAELSAKTSMYTPQHPDIIRLKKQIADLERLASPAEKPLSPAVARSAESSASVERTSNPVVAQLESEAKANALEIGNRRAEVQELQKQIEHYQGRLNQAPVREQQLTEITRNYNQSRANYESLLAKKMQSQMATNLEKRQGGAQYRVLDPPSLPQKPFTPKRLQIALGGLAGGLVLGVLLSLLAELINGRIYCEQDVVQIAGAAILATVPPLPTAGEIRARSRHKALEIALAGFLVVVIPALTVLTYVKG